MTRPHDPSYNYPGNLVPAQSRRRRRWPWITLAVLVFFFVVGHFAPPDTDPATAPVAEKAATSAPTTSTPPPVTTIAEAVAATLLAAPNTARVVESPAAATAALTQLSTLEVKGRAPKTGYDRGNFGQAWSDDVTVDAGHNGCDTRNDVLRRDLTSVVATAVSRGCTVTAGVLADPYTGTSVSFTRGQTSSTDVQIDHVVALSDAWQKGAQQLDTTTLRNFANDPRNLQAVSGPINAAKSDGDAATWLPPNKAFRCTYVARQVEVKADYRLWVTDAERDAIAGILTDCGGTPIPTTTVAPTTIIPTEVAAAPPTVEPVVVPMAVPDPVPAYTPAPEPVYTSAPEPPSSSSDGGYGGGSCGGDSYINSAGNCVQSPMSAPSAPAGASAQCNDGTYSFSQSRRGTCSGHGGVGTWL
ncbi:DUF3761 domain-containing protein [Rhodococcus sp. NBC_00294]|uniref:DUF3761 domain-containing protein n=1 Tax=Rhodococcus sp. NBC_00294 TaxID=2976004 RepID=UPI002E2CC662|nr:DUF1524 domain-containing protein [Rhodococcus sp. NBC_00294]